MTDTPGPPSGQPDQPSGQPENPPQPGWPASPAGQPQPQPPPPGGPPGTPGPPPGPPGWSPQAPPPGGNKGSKTPWLIALAVVAIAVIAGVAFLVTDDDDSDPGGDGPGGETAGGPVAAVEEFMAAEADKDCNTAMSLLTGNALEAGYGSSDTEAALQTCEDFVAQEEASGITRDRTVHNIEVVSEGDGQATVSINATDTVTNGVEESSTYTQEIGLVEESGSWMIDSLGTPEV